MNPNTVSLSESQAKIKSKLQYCIYDSSQMSPSCTNRPRPISMGFMGGTGSGVLLLPLETKLCAATSAVSLVACHFCRPSVTACFCSGVHLRFLFASSEQVREQNRPRLVCLSWHCSQVFSLYATGDAHYHCKHDFSAVFSTMSK
jgi:hypothetical protein